MVIEGFADEAKASLAEVTAIESGQDLAQHSPQNIDDDAQKQKAKNWLWFPVAFFSAVPFLPSRKRGVIGVFQFFVLVSIYTGVIFMVGFNFAN